MRQLRKLRPTALLALAAAAVLVAVIALALAHSGSSSSTTARPAGVQSGQVSVAIDNFSYTPSNLTVKVGSTITVTNKESVEHTLSADDGSFNTGTFNNGQSAHFRLTKPGVYSFHCEFHAFMKGSVKVVP
jgi:plastocyanin